MKSCNTILITIVAVSTMAVIACGGGAQESIETQSSATAEAEIDITKAPTVVPIPTTAPILSPAEETKLYTLEELFIAGFINQENTTEIYDYKNLVEAWKGTMIGIGEDTDLDILLFDGPIASQIKTELENFATFWGGSIEKIKFVEPNLVIFCDPIHVCTTLSESLPKPFSEVVVKSTPVASTTPTQTPVPSATPTQTSVPSPTPTQTSAVDTSDWISITNKTNTMSVSVPPDWKVINEIETLSNMYSEIEAQGLAPLLFSVDEKTGANVFIFADVRELFELEPAPIALKPYVGSQIDDLVASLGISDDDVEADSTKVDAIEGVLLTIVRGENTMFMNILVDSEPRMICGSMPVLVQTVGSSGDPIPEKIISTFEVHENAAFTNDCSNRRALSFIE